MNEDEIMRQFLIYRDECTNSGNSKNENPIKEIHKEYQTSIKNEPELLVMTNKLAITAGKQLKDDIKEGFSTKFLEDEWNTDNSHEILKANVLRKTKPTKDDKNTTAIPLIINIRESQLKNSKRKFNEDNAKDDDNNDKKSKYRKLTQPFTTSKSKPSKKSTKSSETSTQPSIRKFMVMQVQTHGENMASNSENSKHSSITSSLSEKPTYRPRFKQESKSQISLVDNCKTSRSSDLNIHM